MDAPSTSAIIVNSGVLRKRSLTHQVQLELTDQLYDLATRRAVEAGFESVTDYIADMVSDDLALDTESLDHRFTPERLALIDKAAAQISAGQGYTIEEVREHLAEKRAEWLQNNAR